jgi:Fic family protein
MFSIFIDIIVMDEGCDDMSYKPPYTISSKMLDLVSNIMKQIGKLSNSYGLDNKPKLRRTNMINSIYSSLAIENNALSKDQVKDIVNGKLVIGPRRDIAEVQNAKKCYDSILNINPYSIEDLLAYHAIMLEGLVEDAGKFRTKQEGVFDGDTVIFIAPSADRVPEHISNLFEYLNQDSENILIKSCVFHYEFEFIHPFSDGNGRIGRLFQTCLLASKEEIFAYLPIESIIKERQQEYYESISKCNKVGNSNIFIEFMLDAILETINRTIDGSRQEISEISIQVKKLLKVMRINTPYTTIELMEALKLKSRASFKKNYLDPAIGLNLVNMTLPNTPNSRNQRYQKI